MTNEYERAMLEQMLEISANSDGCLIHDNAKGFNISRKDRRKSQPKKPKGSKYFFKK